MAILPKYRNTSDLNQWILLICILALVLRISFLLALFHVWPVEQFWHSGLESNYIAASIASGHGFSSPYGVASGPTAWVAPLYPLIAAGAFTFFGVFSVKALWFLLIFNSLCGVATVPLIYLIGIRCFGSRVALVASVLWAVSLDAIAVCPRTWESSLSALLATTSIWFYLYLLDSPSRKRNWVLYGLLWALAALTNTALLALLPVPLIVLLLRRRTSSRQHVILALLVFAACLAPWTARNFVVFRRVVPIRGNFGPNLWYGNHPGVGGPADETLIPANNSAELQEFVRLGDAGYATSRQEKAYTFIRQHPTSFVYLTAVRVVFFWTSTRLSGRLLPGACFLLAIGGLVSVTRRQVMIAVPFLGAILLYPIPYYITHSENVYRFPIEPTLALLLTYAAISLIQMMMPERALGKQSLQTPWPATRR